MSDEVARVVVDHQIEVEVERGRRGAPAAPVDTVLSQASATATAGLYISIGAMT